MSNDQPQGNEADQGAQPTRPVPDADHPTEPVPDAAAAPPAATEPPAAPEPSAAPETQAAPETPEAGWGQGSWQGEPTMDTAYAPPTETNTPPASAPPASGAVPAGGYPQAPAGGGPPAGGYPQGGYTQGAYPQGGYPSGSAGATDGSGPASGYAAAGYGAGYAGGYGGGYGAGGYPAAGYGYPPVQQRTDDKAIWALVSSIAGFVLCPFVLHIVGWVLANQSLRSIRESQGALRGEGVAKTARVLGIVGVVLSALGLIAAVLFFAVAIPLGIFAATTSDNNSFDIGNETVTPTSLAAIDGESFSHDAGDVTYDLTDLDFAGRAADMSVSLGAGTLTIEVPSDVTVNLDAEVGAGQLDAFGNTTDGISVTRTGTFDGEDGAEAVLDLSATVAIGELEVSRG